MAQLEAFVGEWKEQTKEGLDELGIAIGLPKDQIDLYKAARTAISYSIDGDKWTINVGPVGDEQANKTFYFKLGEEYPSKDLDGTPMTSFVNSNDGTTLYEKHTFEDGKLKGREMQINRKIEDGTMIVTTTIAGKSMLSKYRKD